MENKSNRVGHRVTVEDIMIGAAFGALMVTLARFVRGTRLNPKLGRKCRADKSTVWRYIVGCDVNAPVAVGTELRRGYPHFTRHKVAVCAVCAAMDAAACVMASPSSPEHQSLLMEFQAARGIADYREFRYPSTWPAWHVLMATARADVAE